MPDSSFKEKRNFPRFLANLPLALLEQKIKKTFTAQTHDISSHGLCVITDQQMSPGSDFDMCIRMLDNNEQIRVKGQVVWSNMIDSLKYRTGIKLADSVLKPIPMVLRTIMARRQF